MATVSINFRLDQKKAAKLSSLAKAHRQTRTEVLEEALESYFFLQELNLAKIDAGLKAIEAGDLATEDQVEAEFARWRGRK